MSQTSTDLRTLRESYFDILKTIQKIVAHTAAHPTLFSASFQPVQRSLLALQAQFEAFTLRLLDSVVQDAESSYSRNQTLSTGGSKEILDILSRSALIFDGIFRTRLSNIYRAVKMVIDSSRASRHSMGYDSVDWEVTREIVNDLLDEVWILDGSLGAAQVSGRRTKIVVHPMISRYAATLTQ